MTQRSLRAALLLALAGLAAGCNNAPPPAGAVCERVCLAQMADRYLTALAGRNAASLPLARNVRYTENGQVLELNDGLWGTATEVGGYRQIFADSRGDELGLYATLRENGYPVLLATRLKLTAGQVTEIESVVMRPPSRTAPALERMEREGSKPWWDELVPEGERLTREELIVTAGKYFIGLEKNDGKGEYPFTSDCYRFENGNLATGNAEMARLADEAEKKGGPQQSGQPTSFGYRLMSYPCKEQFELGYMKMVDRIRDRRFPVVDVERGVVFTLVFFDHSGTVHEVTTTDGKTHSVGLRQPFTWEIAEAFKIRKGPAGTGQIRAIEAVLTQSPYAMKPNWPEQTAVTR
jgi:hypothetical protein